LACDILKAHQHLCQCLLNTDDFEFIQTMANEASSQLSPKEAVTKFTELCEGYKKVLGIDHLNGSHEKMVVINLIEKYVSVSTALARVRWMSQKDFKGVEALMNEVLEVVETSLEKIASGGREPMLNKIIGVIKVNLAHAVYMQEGRHMEAMALYENIVAENVGLGGNGILACEPIVLANLCVVYILSK
jgi:hypothetical protein